MSPVSYMTLSAVSFSRSRPIAKASIGWLGSLAVYAVLAGVVFIVHGAEPPLMIDHLAYMKQADDILLAHPDGDYWRSVNQLQSYAVVMAYLYGLTGSHISSLKFLLATMTVLSLLAFELLIGPVVTAKWKAVLITLLSAFFVTFGASFWGYTDFAASVQRTALIPCALAITWFWLYRGDSALKFIVFPALVALSVVHLSAYHLAAILGLVALWDWAARRHFSLDRRFWWLVVSLVAAAGVKFALEKLALAFTNDLSSLVIPTSGPRLDPETAWRIELMAFPWRNMPLPPATLLTIVASYGLIFLMASAGVMRAMRLGLTQLDRSMLTIAGAAVAFAYGPQTLLWIARQFWPIYPFSLEETRAINFIMIPSLYFVYRLFDSLWSHGSFVRSRAIPAAVVLLVLLQPLFLLRVAPDDWKNRAITIAVEHGLIQTGDSLRLMYARNVLALPEKGARFYYSARGVIGWLSENTCTHTRVVSTLNELILVDVERIGPFNGMIDKALASPDRKVWAESVVDVDRAIRSRDWEQVELAGQKYGATLAVVPWPSPNALYSDAYYSIVPIKTGTTGCALG